MNPILELNAVTRRFGDRLALDGLSLSLYPGEVFALLGPNGAGKTTTLNLILGFLQPDAGAVAVCGKDVGADPAKARQSIAYLPEQVAIYPELSGLENLRYFSMLASVDLDDSELRRLLNDAGLADETHDRAARGYSKGMRQKVAIAIAMARQTRLLLLDEPTSGLDPAAASELSGVIRSAANRGIAVLMATHDLYRLKEVANRVGILHRGKIISEMDPRTVSHTALEQLYIDQFTK